MQTAYILEFVLSLELLLSKELPRMPILAIIMIIVAVLLILLGIPLLFFTWRRAWGLTHPPRKALTRTPADLGVAHENVTFPTEEGLTLSGWFIPAKNG